MNLQLEDRTFLVTAASRGLGFGVAQALVAENANVFICGRSEDSLKEATSRLGDRANYQVANVAVEQEVDMLLDYVQSSITALDGLYVNAGGPPPGDFNKVDDSDWKRAVDLTLMSAVWLTRKSLPLLKKSSSSSILYSTSISVKQPIDNLLLSNVVRPAVVGLMRTLSSELGPEGIRVNAVGPGYVRTERVKELLGASEDADKEIIQNIPLGRMGTPEEFGALCAFLLSPKASYIHGSFILIDGGLYKGMT